MQRLQSSDGGDAGHDWGTYEVAIQSFETMQNTIAQHKLAAYPPDALIEIPRNACRTLDYDRASEMIDMGYQKAAEHFPSGD